MAEEMALIVKSTDMDGISQPSVTLGSRDSEALDLQRHCTHVHTHKTKAVGSVPFLKEVGGGMKRPLNSLTARTYSLKRSIWGSGSSTNMAVMSITCISAPKELMPSSDLLGTRHTMMSVHYIMAKKKKKFRTCYPA